MSGILTTLQIWHENVDTCGKKSRSARTSGWQQRTRLYVQILKIYKSPLITSCHQNSRANLDMFAKEQRLVSSLYFVSQKFNWRVDRSRPCLGFKGGSWLFQIVWRWLLPHAVRRACLKGNPVVTDTKVFVTTIISNFKRNSRKTWQSVARIASERWEIDLVKERRRDVKVGDSLSNLIIEIHLIRFWCTRFSSSTRKGLRQYHELMQRIQCCIYALINMARIGDEYCLFGLWLHCSR